MKMKPSTVSWHELQRHFNICNLFCPDQSSCNKAILLQTNFEHEVVPVCGKRPINEQATRSDDAYRIRKKLRLILFEQCHRNCVGCCNKDFDLVNLPICRSFNVYDCIMLSGGEPMLDPNMVSDTITRIRRETETPIILYTALTADKEALSRIIHQIDGVTVTLHENSDVKPFLEFDEYHITSASHPISYRLNIFKGVEIDLGEVKGKWKVKSGIEWIKDCPLPKGEVLMRLDNGDKRKDA